MLILDGMMLMMLNQSGFINLNDIQKIQYKLIQQVDRFIAFKMAYRTISPHL